MASAAVSQKSGGTGSVAKSKQSLNLAALNNGSESPANQVGGGLVNHSRAQSRDQNAQSNIPKDELELVVDDGNNSGFLSKGLLDDL